MLLFLGLVCHPCRLRDSLVYFSNNCYLILLLASILLIPGLPTFADPLSLQVQLWRNKIRKRYGYLKDLIYIYGRNSQLALYSSESNKLKLY
jgi:hypothetical protein